jgi:hypothetical protein
MIDSMRRMLLTHAPAAAAWSAFATPAATHAAEAGVDQGVSAADDGFITFADKNEKFKALFRLERDLRDEGITLSTYQFITYALVYGQRPQPIVRWEGMEFSYFRRITGLTWRIHAHNLSYPRDLHTGEFTSRVRNPFTDSMIDIEPMKLLDDPGVLHGPKGYLPLDAKTVNWLDTYHVLRTEGPLIKSEHIRPTPDGWPAMFIESSCSTVSRKDFFDPSVTALPYQTSGFYVFPFPAWMKMGDQPGQMIGAWSGRRAVNGQRDLPRTFRERVARENPELLEPRWRELDRPLSAVLQQAIAP